MPHIPYFVGQGGFMSWFGNTSGGFYDNLHSGAGLTNEMHQSQTRKNQS